MSDTNAHPRTRAAFCRFVAARGVCDSVTPPPPPPRSLLLAVYIERFIATSALSCVRSRVLTDYSVRPTWYGGAATTHPPLPSTAAGDSGIGADLSQYVRATAPDAPHATCWDCCLD